MSYCTSDNFLAGYSVNNQIFQINNCVHNTYPTHFTTLLRHTHTFLHAYLQLSKTPHPIRQCKDKEQRSSSLLYGPSFCGLTEPPWSPYSLCWLLTLLTCFLMEVSLSPLKTWIISPTPSLQGPITLLGYVERHRVSRFLQKWLWQIVPLYLPLPGLPSDFPERQSGRAISSSLSHPRQP